jgi:hypothetical protein
MKLLHTIAASAIVLTVLVSAAFAGDPIPGIDVHLRSSNGKTFHVKTDAQGAFTFSEVPAGTYEVFVSNKACRMAINTKGIGTKPKRAQSSQREAKPTTASSSANDWTVDTQPPTIAIDVDQDGMPDVVTAREAGTGKATGRRSPREAASGMATGRRSGSVILIGDDCDDTVVACATVTFSKKKEFKGHVTLLK